MKNYRIGIMTNFENEDYFVTANNRAEAKAKANEIIANNYKNYVYAFACIEEA